MWETWVQSLGWEDLLENGMATPLHYSGLENSMDCVVHGVAKSQTWLSDFHFNFTSSHAACVVLLMDRHWDSLRRGILCHKAKKLYGTKNNCIHVHACVFSRVSRVWLCDPMDSGPWQATWTVACQAPLSMGFSRQEYLARVARPSSRGSSWPRDWTHVF